MLSQSPEMVVALQNLSQGQPTPVGKISATLSKSKKGSSLLAKTLSQKGVFETASSFSNTQIKCSQPIIHHEYFTKKHFKIISTIEDGFLFPNSMFTLHKMFSGWTFKPWDTSKTHLYYTSILEATNSVTIKHHFLPDHPTESAYSTIQIHKFLTPLD